MALLFRQATRKPLEKSWKTRRHYCGPTGGQLEWNIVIWVVVGLNTRWPGRHKRDWCFVGRNATLLIFTDLCLADFSHDIRCELRHHIVALVQRPGNGKQFNGDTGDHEEPDAFSC